MILFVFIGVNILIYLFGYDGTYSYKYGNCYIDTIANRQYFRLISSGFVHADVMHLFCNMVSLYSLGNSIVYMFGTIKFISIYFICLVVGGIISVFMHHLQNDDYRYSIGASGAICGLLGFYVAAYIKTVLILRPILATSNIVIDLLRMVAPLLVTMFDSRIDNMGHISGFIVGIVIGIISL